MARKPKDPIALASELGVNADRLNAAKAIKAAAAGGGTPTQPVDPKTGAVVPGITVQGTQVVPSNTPPVLPTYPGATAPLTQQTGVVTPSLAQATDITKLPASAVLSAQEINQAKAALQDASFFDTAKSNTVHWLSELFNVDDTLGVSSEHGQTPTVGTAANGGSGDLTVMGVPLGGVENVFDHFLGGMNWGYDRLSQVEAAGVSGLPGGMKTLSWSEANDVSVGQALVGSMGAAAGRVERGQMQPSDWFMLPGTLISAALAQADTNNVAQSEKFDITKADQKQAAFGSGWGEWTTGLLDTAVTIFADPTIIAGKAAKVTKLRYLDRLVDSQKAVDRMQQEITYGKDVLTANASHIDTDRADRHPHD